MPQIFFWPICECIYWKLINEKVIYRNFGAFKSAHLLYKHTNVGILKMEEKKRVLKISERITQQQMTRSKSGRVLNIGKIEFLNNKGSSFFYRLLISKRKSTVIYGRLQNWIKQIWIALPLEKNMAKDRKWRSLRFGRFCVYVRVIKISAKEVKNSTCVKRAYLNNVNFFFCKQISCLVNIHPRCAVFYIEWVQWNSSNVSQALRTALIFFINVL